MTRSNFGEQPLGVVAPGEHPAQRGEHLDPGVPVRLLPDRGVEVLVREPDPGGGGGLPRGQRRGRDRRVPGVDVPVQFVPQLRPVVKRRSIVPVAVLETGKATPSSMLVCQIVGGVGGKFSNFCCLGS